MNKPKMLLMSAVGMLAGMATAQLLAAGALAAPAPVLAHNTLADCITALTEPGFCRIGLQPIKAMRSVYYPGERGVIGSRAMIDAYNGAAFDADNLVMYFSGGGHNDSGVIDVCAMEWQRGRFRCIYTAPPFNNLVARVNGGVTQYAARHDAGVPDASHVYNSIVVDPDTGLILLYTDYPFTWGWTADRDSLPAGLKANGPLGKGFYAFNPTDMQVKRVEPGQWRQVGEPPPTRDGVTALAYLGDGRWAGSGPKVLWKAAWVGDRLVVDPASRRSVTQSGTPVLKLIDGRLVRVNNVVIEEYDPDSLRLLSTWPVDMKAVASSGTLAAYGDKLLFWNGRGKVTSVSRDGKVLVYKFPNPVKAVKGHAAVFNKWFRHPDHPDIYLGIASATGFPVVYRHGETGGRKGVTFTEPGLQPQIDAAGSGPLKIKSGDYHKGAKLTGSTDVDYSGVRSIARPHNHGYLTVDGGPHRIRGLKLSGGGEAALWLQHTARATVEDFNFSGQQFGIITSNDGGELHIRNGVIRNGGRCSRFGNCHNVYAGDIDLVTVDGLKSYGRNDGGHLFKSRAARTLIDNALFDGGKSRHSRLLDFPCGGHVEIRNSTMIQSPNSDNGDLMAIAVEDRICGLDGTETHTLLLENTRWEYRKQVKARRVLSSHHPVRITCVGDNVFVGVESICP